VKENVGYVLGKSSSVSEFCWLLATAMIVGGFGACGNAIGSCVFAVVRTVNGWIVGLRSNRMGGFNMGIMMWIIGSG